MRFVFLGWVLTFVMVLAARATFAAAAATGGPEGGGWELWLSSVLVDLADQHPVIVTLLLAMALLRVVFKPLVTLAHWYVLRTKSKEDDAALERVERSRWYAWVTWIIDFFASIKVTPRTEGQKRLAGVVTQAEALAARGSGLLRTQVT